jgi:ADP-dependent NAD(P)H-hydrate dehydratase / NAD(P)H-hydrate epimerase
VKLVTAEQMRRLDQAAITGGIPARDLMERAGAGLADAAKRRVSAPATILILVGPGNNGGDGLVAARHLAQAGFTVRVVPVQPREASTPAALVNWARLDGTACQIIPADDLTPACVQASDCIIDALLGTGIHRPVRDPIARLITMANDSGVAILAADIPSGLDADTGAPHGVAICAAQTITFGLPKLGLMMPIASDMVGQMEVVDIGLPIALIEAFACDIALNGRDAFFDAWPTRPAEGHKGTFGHAGIIAGSREMPGAGYLASRAALRVGAGRVTYLLPEGAATQFDAQAAEVMTTCLPDAGAGHFMPDSVEGLSAHLKQKNAVALGPGLGRAPDTATFVRDACARISAPLVLDADALMAIATDQIPGAAHRTTTIITPHPGEMAAVLGSTVAAIEADRLGVARRYAQEHQVIVVLKGHRTIVAFPDGRRLVNPTGNAGMATAGAGDVLTGVITGLLAQGMPGPSAAAAGVYLHGLAGDIATQHKGMAGVIASDIIEALPSATQLLTHCR